MAIGRHGYSAEALSLPGELLDPDGELGWIAQDPFVQPLTCSRACCCTASAKVRVLLPVPGDPDRLIDLFFCSHHFRRHGDALIRSNAHVVRELPADTEYPAGAAGSQVIGPRAAPAR